MSDLNETLPRDELGAHVSAAGGCQNAPERAAARGSRVLQLFTKPPQRWAEPELTEADVDAFRRAREVHGIDIAVTHASYLPNLASPKPELHERSLRAITEELRRCDRLGIEYLVEHPGNATDRDVPSGLARNSDAIAEALERAGGATVFLIETTAGAGTVLGSTFEEVAELIDRIPDGLQHRVGVCLDTCHVYAAGYDLRADYDGVMMQFDDLIGLDRLQVLHLNDSQGTLGSNRDRHAGIGEGELGTEPFRRIMTDERLRSVTKILETPKLDDAVATDRHNLEILRSLRRSASAA